MCIRDRSSVVWHSWKPMSDKIKITSYNTVFVFCMPSCGVSSSADCHRAVVMKFWHGCVYRLKTHRNLRLYRSCQWVAMRWPQGTMTHPVVFSPSCGGSTRGLYRDDLVISPVSVGLTYKVPKIIPVMRDILSPFALRKSFLGRWKQGGTTIVCGCRDVFIAVSQ